MIFNDISGFGANNTSFTKRVENRPYGANLGSSPNHIVRLFHVQKSWKSQTLVQQIQGCVSSEKKRPLPGNRGLSSEWVFTRWLFLIEPSERPGGYALAFLIGPSGALWDALAFFNVGLF